jgi:cytochrome o ubiquinol oxidase subunit I
MGAGADVNAIFGIMSMIIAVPTGVKVFNWLFTLYGGRVRFTVPVYWALGFMMTFLIGGMTGVLLAIPPADFVLHNSLFLIAHFHNTIIGGVVFGVFAGYTYWFPKAFGFQLEERLGKAIFWCWFIGFYLAFMPLYVLGLMGATRRMQHYADPHWQPLMLVALAGALLILLGIVLTIVQLVVSIRWRDRLRDLTGDPWNGRTLEWSTASPPPAWNYSLLPQIEGGDAYWAKKQARDKPDGKEAVPQYEAIHVPRGNPTGFFLSFFAVALGFAVIWHIWWMAIFGLIGGVAIGLVQAWRTDSETEISAAEVAAFEHGRVAREAAI